MITKKKTTIPIYGAGFAIYVADDITEFKDYCGMKDVYEIPKAADAFFTYDCDIYLFEIFIEAKTSVPVIAHECHHIKNSLWDCIGHKPTLLDDEPDAYLLEYLIKQVLKVKEKHNSNKDKNNNKHLK